MDKILTILVQGFVFSLGLIIAIGAQNAFILRQGISKKHVFAAAFTATISDSILIFLGVGGLGSIISQNELLLLIAKWGGFIFLFIYGLKSFLSIVNKEKKENHSLVSQPTTLKATIMASLGFSLLNPHVYIDTLVLIGSLGAQFQESDRIYFALGASLSSLVWFFTLAYGASYFAPILSTPIAEKILNFVIGVIMWSVAIGLLFQ